MDDESTCLFVVEIRRSSFLTAFGTFDLTL